MYSPEDSTAILALRAKVLSGQPVTLEETRAGIELLRKARAGAHLTSEKSRAKAAAKAPVNSDDLLSQLDGLN